jgi:hypothetical protein
MPSPKLEDFTRVLIVEGYSDLHFYAEFLETLGKPNSVFIKAFNGKSDILVQLETFITPQLLKEKAKIAVIVDADESAAGALDSVRNKLTAITGQTLTAHGTWTGGTPDIGLFVTPDGLNTGEIETLVWQAWSADPANAAAKTCIEQYRDCMAAAGRVAKSPDKGLLSTLLAIHNDEDPRLGPGAQKNVFDFERPEFAGLRAFFSNF